MNNVRYAIIEDAQSIAQINVAAWKEAYKGLLPEELLASRKVDEKRINAWKKKIDDKSFTVLVYEDDGEVRGYLSAGSKRDDIQYAHELYAIYVDPSFQKQGVGSSLFEEYKKIIKNSSFYLYMLKGNAKASAFYKKMGGHRDMEYDRILNVDNYEIEEIIYIFK